MKNIFLALSASFLAMAIFLSFTTGTKQLPAPGNDEILNLFPTEVSTILNNSCFQCHNSDSKNVDAKKGLNFSEWKKYSVIKKVGKLKKVCETITEDEMPPEKFLERFPHKKLTDEQVKLLCKWVKEESEKIVKNMN